MYNFKTWFVSIIINDPTMQGYISDGSGGYNVFPMDVSINADPVTSAEKFPSIIYSDAGWSVMSRPAGLHVGRFQVDIYSINNSTEVETIYTRLAQLFNFQDSVTSTEPVNGTIWWIREDSVKDMHDSSGSRRLYKKNIILKAWFSNPDFT